MKTHDRNLKIVSMTADDAAIIARSSECRLMVSHSVREACKLAARRRTHVCAAIPEFWRMYSAASVPSVIRIA